MDRTALWALILSLCPAVVLAQQPPPPAEVDGQGMFGRLSAKMDDLLESLGADGGFDPDKTMDWSVLPGPFYTPEMELGLGVSAVGLYQVDRQDTVSQISSFTVNGFASVNGALGAEIISQTFFQQDRYRLFINAEVVDAPEVFYGVGLDAGRVKANKIDFDRRGYRFKPQLLTQIWPATFVGLGFDFSQNEGRKVEPFAPRPFEQALQFPDSSTTAALTLHLMHDSRDFILNAREGRLLQADLALYRDGLGSDSVFEKYNLEYSDYWGVGPGILAWQFAAEFNHGEVPWDQLAQLGGGTRLRGYNSGRYRDKQMGLAQLEYRHDLPRRHGMVYWLGAGTLAESVSELGSDKWLHSVGLGYRFEVKQRVNLRLDMAWGNGESGFYFAVNEVF
ncbi:BamA/TamA family outer membrane protein [Ferrimonas pelagia]|uniref:BamA/TamA family outer membrane protein n=1 Tax=Ferrimonas pelagia TaxID=1177826 RepID=A0ABP9FBT4_9GAMM